VFFFSILQCLLHEAVNQQSLALDFKENREG